MRREILTGSVVFFDDARGFWFICPDDGATDIFVHRSGLIEPLDTLSPDQRVVFSVRFSEP